MGRKNKNKNSRKKKQHSQPLPPLAEDFKQYLYLEALEGINKMKLSKDLFLAKEVKEAYILSKQWLDQWKLHVGYDAVLKGSQPAGKKYGRIQIAKINSDIIANDEEFHDAPESYSYFNPPMIHKVQPAKDYILINQEAWEYFREKYEGSTIKRIQNEQKEFPLKLISPFVLFLTQEKIQKIQSLNTNQLAAQIEQLRIRRIQAFSDWQYKDLILYFKEFMEVEKLQLWLVNPVLELSQIKMQLMKTINSQKNLIFGEQLLDIEYESLPLSSFLKNQYLLIVADEKFELTQMEFKFEQNQNGCCFNCGNKALLNIICACKNAFYCSDTCRYYDQEFHSKICPKAYDSEDDDRFDEIDYEVIQKSKGVGLVNLGNTCYMNSSLQSLFSSTHFQKFLSNKQYWNENIEKKNVQLNYKLEKLLKNLLVHEKAFSPYSFRQQLAKKFPFFGNNFQQDAAEFLLYLFDALNEELITKDGQMQYQKNEVITQQIDTEEKEQQISDSDDEGSSDEEHHEDQQADQQQTQQIQFHKKVQQNQINNDNYEQALDQILKQNSHLINSNFMGITKSEVECPICTTKTYSYEQFSILPLSLNVTSQTKHLVDIYVVFADWYKPYHKETYEYQPNQTLLMDLKRDIGEKLHIIPTFLLGVICSDHRVDQYLFHDEDSIDKIIREYNNAYICIFELDQEIQTITDEDQYFDVSIFSFEKRTAYSYQCESIAVSIPKILIIRKDATSLQIYQQIWHKLGEFSHSDQLIQGLIDEPQQQDLLTPQQVLEALTYQIIIETRLPAKTLCPFSCAKQYKKEQKSHSCEFPYNNSITLDQYLQKINYKNAHTSFLIEFKENAIPKQIRIEFEQRTSYQNKEKSLALQDLLGNFQSKEPLIDENAYHCMTCNDLTFAIKSMKIQRLPDQLIMQLKRFQYDEHKGFQKNNVLVTYPEKITINNITYQLYGVVQHFGGLDNGHYTAYGLRQNTWIEFNDELTSEAKNVLNDKNAYILFYQQE